MVLLLCGDIHQNPGPVDYQDRVNALQLAVPIYGVKTPRIHTQGSSVGKRGLSTGQKIIWYKDIDRTAGFETQTLRDVNVSDGGKYACAEIGKTTVSQALVLTVRVQNDEIDQYAVIEK
ncbi:low affinity immunoglobulin gamma Fc region receptor II-like protein [Labeo rohita]|nr:low affinity immunoglobulin gamma Fc region receptor II-like protein [Labeo rohita]